MFYSGIFSLKFIVLLNYKSNIMLIIDCEAQKGIKRKGGSQLLCHQVEVAPFNS